MFVGFFPADHPQPLGYVILDKIDITQNIDSNCTSESLGNVLTDDICFLI